jgi:cold shock CspA family protein
MAKSRETFNKKEKEKKKLKKKQEKLEKKEARKADKGTDFDDMIAYVDEYGNFSSTPPDPSKKTKIDPSTIQVGVQKQEEVEPPDPIRTGVVTFFNESKGFGFIKDQETQESVFVHYKALLDNVLERDKVVFEVEKTPRGLSALRVKLLK